MRPYVLHLDDGRFTQLVKKITESDNNLRKLDYFTTQ